MNTSTRDRDTITASDLSALRAQMVGHAGDDSFSDEFRAVCCGVITAIDQARDDDEATHAPLEASLHRFQNAGLAELDRCQRLCNLFNRIGDASDSATIRAALVGLIPLLPKRHVLLLSAVIGDALAASYVCTGALDLAAMPVASAHTH